MKKLLNKTVSLALIALLATSISLTNIVIKPVEAQTTPKLYVYPSSYTPSKVGEIFQIQVKIYQVWKLFSYEFKLGFNITQMQCVNAAQGNFFPASSSNSIIQINNTEGYISINCTLKPGIKPINGNGILLFVNFNATYGVPYPKTRETSQLHIYETYLNRYFAGDIDKNTKVGLSDLVLLAKAYGSKPGDPHWDPEADLDKNDAVGLSDLVILSKVYGVEGLVYGMEHNLEDGSYYTPWLAPDLELTLTTDKDSYTFNETVYVSGSLRGNGYPITDAYVAVEVDTPAGLPIIVRTIPTGTIPPAGPIEILSVTPCDEYGNPKNSFKIGTWVYFKVRIQNISNQTLTVLVPTTIFDSRNATQGILSLTRIIDPGYTSEHIVGLYIENTASTGNATAYVSVLTNWVKHGGVALCNEKSATFTITTTSGLGTTQENSVIQTTNIGILAAGNYEFTFSIPSRLAPSGTYVIYASSIFMEKTVFNSKGITVS
jgi:hypothetical protein